MADLSLWRHADFENAPDSRTLVNTPFNHDTKKKMSQSKQYRFDSNNLSVFRMWSSKYILNKQNKQNAGDTLTSNLGDILRRKRKVTVYYGISLYSRWPLAFPLRENQEQFLMIHLTQNEVQNTLPGRLLIHNLTTPTKKRTETRHVCYGGIALVLM